MPRPTGPTTSPPVVADAGGVPASAGLRALVAPVYLPSFVYSAGASILVPVQVLLALRLGFSPGGVTMMATVIGAGAVGSSIASGHLVDRLGELRAVVLATALGIAALLVAAGAALTGVPGARWVLMTALLLFDLADAVWSLARQGMVADRVDPALRGRAMNLYGACQRLGRMVGPFVAAGVLALTDAALALPLTGLVVGLATVMLLRGARGDHVPAAAAPGSGDPGSGDPGSVDPGTAVAFPPGVPDETVSTRDISDQDISDQDISDQDTSAGTASTRAASAGAEPDAGRSRPGRRPVAALGVGVLVLAALRTAKETLVPLWASHGVHLAAPHVALVVGFSSMMELVLFWPAGQALDRLGRMPVVVTALALMGAGLALLPLHATPGWLVASCLLVGLGDGAGAGIVKTLGIDLAPTENRARFLGWWSSIASAGSFAAPAVASALVVVASLPVALVCLGATGLAGAGWMAWWTPRVLPPPRRR